MAEVTADPPRWRAGLDVITSVVLIVAALSLIIPRLGLGEPEPPIVVPSAPIALDGTARLGDPAAPVAMVVFSDFECPFCADFANDILPILREAYIDTRLVQLSFRHRPLTSVHSVALRAAHASACAHEQGHFWKFHDQLFTLPGRLDDEALTTIAHRSLLDQTLYAGCLKAVPTAVALDMELAERLKIHGTPAFLFGRVRESAVRVSAVMAGIAAVERYRQRLDELLAAK